MAAFFKIPVSAGAAPRAEHVLAVRPEAARTLRPACCWRRDAEGRLTRAWSDTLASADAAEPLPFALAA